MYVYNDFDRDFVTARAAALRDQVARRVDGTLSEAEFRPLRLMNGLYLMLHAYMLRVAIPYGTLSSRKMRALAEIADRWDKGYGHFTTRQNIQFNWPKLRDVPDILDALAQVGMHSIQSSGNCIRNITADHFAGAARDEVDDPRPTAELIRQWSTGHPEFAFLPRKFKFAVIGSDTDRAVSKMHDVGIRLMRDASGVPGYRITVGGGLGRTPMVGQTLREFLPRADLLPYLEAILQTYNLIGRRDNKYKARIKITLLETGLEALKSQIEQRFALQRGRFDGTDQRILDSLEKAFAPPNFVNLPSGKFDAALAKNGAFRSFIDTNTAPHKQPGYAILTVSLKPYGGTPGDASSDQMRLLADIAETYCHDELRVSHEQNIVLPHVPRAYLPAIYSALKGVGLASANIGLVSDIIACPGMDYCDLATARSIPVAQQIASRFRQMEHEIGPIKVKISGCINACGHHHVADIGILGLEKGGVESYQITLGGDAGAQAAIGKPIGPGFSASEILPAVETIIATYLANRQNHDEPFHDAFRRLGAGIFKHALYGAKEARRAA